MAILSSNTGMGAWTGRAKGCPLHLFLQNNFKCFQFIHLFTVFRTVEHASRNTIGLRSSAHCRETTNLFILLLIMDRRTFL